MEEIKLNVISVLEVKNKLDAVYTESIKLDEWVNLGTGSLSFVESGKQVIDGVVSGIKPKPLTPEVKVVTGNEWDIKPATDSNGNPLSKAQIRRAMKKYAFVLATDYGLGKVVRLKRPAGVDYAFYAGAWLTIQRFKPHPRRALIVLDGIKTPVRLKGKR